MSIFHQSCGNAQCSESTKHFAMDAPPSKEARNWSIKGGPPDILPWPSYIFCHVCKMVSTYELVMPGLVGRLSGKEGRFELRRVGSLQDIPEESRDGLILEIKAAGKTAMNDSSIPRTARESDAPKYSDSYVRGLGHSFGPGDPDSAVCKCGSSKAASVAFGFVCKLSRP